MPPVSYTHKLKGHDYTLRAYPDPGKFEGGLVIDQLVYQATLDGVDEEVGDVSEVGVWHGLLRGGFKEDIRRLAQDAGLTLTRDERDFLAEIAGAEVEETDSGFISVQYFETTKEMENKWKQIEEDVGDYDGDEDGDEEEEED